MDQRWHNILKSERWSETRESRHETDDDRDDRDITSKETEQRRAPERKGKPHRRTEKQRLKPGVGVEGSGSIYILPY